MNVKCPNCRFKFDIKQIDVNSNNEVNCTCPRCGKSFTTIAQDEATTPLVSQPIQRQPVVDDAPVESYSQPQGSELDMYYAAMKCIENGMSDEARAYVTQLLALNPHEPLYIKIKEKLDQSDEEKRREEERIKTLYFSAMKCIDSGQLDQAEEHIKSLLAISPNDPMYQNLWNRLIEAKNLEEQRQEELKVRKQEEERRREQELLENGRKALNEMVVGNDFDMDSMKVFNLTNTQVQESSDIISSLPQEVKELLIKLPSDQLLNWMRMSTYEKQQWKNIKVATAKEQLLTPEERRKREEDQLYEKAQDYINQGLYNTARDYVNRLLEMDPDNPKYQALSKKLGNTSNNNIDNYSSGSGCMVVILALIVSALSIAMFV